MYVTSKKVFHIQYTVFPRENQVLFCRILLKIYHLAKKFSIISHLFANALSSNNFF